MFFNTTHEVRGNLKKFEAKTQTQEQKILDIFRKSTKGLTCSEVFKIYPEKNTPLTSIRRAVSNLKDDRKLVKTMLKRPGIYGRNEFVFNLYTGQRTLFN